MITIETTKETDSRWLAELTEGNLYIALYGKTRERAIKSVMREYCEEREYYEELHEIDISLPRYPKSTKTIKCRIVRKEKNG